MLDPGATLSGTTGNVLDPVFAQRHALTLAPGQAVELVSALAAGADRAQVLALTGAAVAGEFEAVFRSAQAEARATLEMLGLPREWRARLPVLTGALAYGAAEPRPGLPLPSRAELPAGGLGALGLTGGLPVVLVHVKTPADVMTAVGLARVAAYWRTRGVGVDLVLLDASGPGLADAVHQVGPAPSPRLGRTLVRRAADEPAAVVARLERLARFVVRAAELPMVAPAPAVTVRFRQAPAEAPGALPADEPLRHWNGHGGFAADGSEYVIRLPADGERQRRPPLAWTNVLANEQFGALATEAGGGYTWSRNSREHRLTPWTNDPIADPPSEALYLSDLDAGWFWSPLPAPAGGGADVEVRHGFGHTSWTRRSQGLTQHVTAFVPRQAPLKVVRVRVTNDGTHPRRLALTTYQALVLGVLEQDTRRAVGTAWDTASGAVLAMNPDAGEFAAGVTFAALVAPEGGTAVEHTAHRGAFLGRDGTLGAPGAVVAGTPLDGRTGRGLDPCAAFRTTFLVAPGEIAEAILLLGEAPDAASARSLVTRFRAPAVVAMELADVGRFWEETLGRLRVETPVPELDLMLNGWLAYQNLACRVWGRSAFYQSGGAFGFRDQLQDAAALTWLDPALTRRQLLLHAAHQFEEGDVLHWWHPPLSKGIRTRFSDDLLWLPLLTAEYVRHTGDTAVLDEPVRFLRAPHLEEGEDETFVVPTEAGTTGTLYEHCCLALDRSLTTGAHGIPLMGTGDWNDGMNRVGRLGRGESVWLGFFLYHILEGFLPHCEMRRDALRLERYRAYRTALGKALNAEGWDGGWYRRAWYDNGAVLGSAESDECRIDTIAQAWAVISGAAARARGHGARRHGAAPRGGTRGHHPPPHPGVRPDAERPRLHQGLPARRARERRPVHARRPLGRARPGGAGPPRPRRSPAAHAEPRAPWRHARGHRALPGGAVRGRGGRLRRRPALGPWRLDLVHRLGGVDVPGGRGVTAWCHRARRPGAPPGALHPGRVAGLPPALVRAGQRPGRAADGGAAPRRRTHRGLRQWRAAGGDGRGRSSSRSPRMAACSTCRCGSAPTWGRATAPVRRRAPRRGSGSPRRRAGRWP
ncbi:MAG: hypothetical protein IPK12_11755 [Gemmatimonadetes bacterium]|nr:hypothetical protein [Gemmatimonadota bacterium]